MAGHSKWANIKHKKGRADAKRAKFWTKTLREVQVAARLGGGDPDSNPRLRQAVVLAKSQNVPKDTLQRAIDRGAGNLEGQDYVELVYEGYAPHGVALLIEVLTDNRNRTAANVRSLFNKSGGSLGTDGSVAYLFSKTGKAWIDGGDEGDLDELLLTAIEAGADDAEEDGSGGLEVSCSFHDLMPLIDALDAAGIPPDRSEVIQVPSTTVSLGLDQAKVVLGLIDRLEDDDDVQRVSHNLELTEELMAAFDA